MTKRHPRRTDEEWMNLIQECRTRGLTDKSWCREHHIQPGNFCYHIHRLRKMACEIPESVAADSHADIQEVVPITFEDPMAYPSERKAAITEQGFDTVIRITVNVFQVELSNHAARETILTTLSVP